MVNKRRSKRIPVQIELHDSDLNNQKRLEIPVLDTPIRVVDVSLYGLGMIADFVLPIGHFLDARIILSPDFPPIRAVVKIIRVQPLGGNTYRYGCEFIDMTEADKTIIESFKRQEEKDYL